MTRPACDDRSDIARCESSQASSATARDGDAGPLDTAILFVDLVSSSEFASVLGLAEYASYVDAFAEVCRTQCRHFFQIVHEGRYEVGRDYRVEQTGDELAVFLHSGKPANDVYQLICLAITIKCAWLGVSINADRIANGLSSMNLAAGIHSGKVWARWSGEGYRLCGFAINLAKRMESATREGEHFQIFVSDPAFKRVNRRLRNVLFSRRRVVSMKGIVVPVGAHEVADTFIDPRPRLAPQLIDGFMSVARQAIGANTFDLWIHSCLQVANASATQRIDDEHLELCRHVLNIDPGNAVALYHAAQAMRDRDEPEAALLYLRDLTRCWPNLADGWLELGRVLKQVGDPRGARGAILQARRHGVPIEEEDLPPLPAAA